MQKERKKSRAKYASTLTPTRHPAFGSGQRAHAIEFNHFKFEDVYASKVYFNSKFDESFHFGD